MLTFSGSRLALAIAATLLACSAAPVDPGDAGAGCLDDRGCTAAPALACRAGRCVAPVCPQGSSYVRGGRFTLGCQPGDPDCGSDAQPAHPVTLSAGFCLAVTELSVGAYRRCLASGACPPPTAPQTLDSLRCSPDLATWTAAAGASEALPMTCLLWSEAQAACLSVGGRLPTEAEWERAARGEDGRSLPWGRGAPVLCDQGVNFAGSGCPGRPWPAVSDGRQGVMLRGPSGSFDLAGNVSEWVADFYAPDGYATCASGCTDPAGPAAAPATGLRVRRGGSYASALSELRTYARDFHLPTGPRSDLVGVRCAFSASDGG